MESIFFSLGTGYEALIGAGAASLTGSTAARIIKGRRAAVITDSGVPRAHVEQIRASLAEAGFSAGVFAVPEGETTKNLKTVEDLYAFFAGLSLTRQDCVIGVGGGVVGDVAGFAAATYLRGVPFISAPTTVISQTDSAYGGKTGVDHLGIKNAVGCFAHPRAVIADPALLLTLPERERVSGMGEVIKYGAIADPSILSSVSRALPDESTIADCVRIKKRFCEADELDMGERRVLNFGHTYGHAIESASDLTVPHGQAVAYGMLAAARLGEHVGVTEKGVYEAILAACEKAGLDTDWRPVLDNALPYLIKDKKSDGETIETVLLTRLGNPVRVRMKPEELML